jgi:hypothetical protein
MEKITTLESILSRQLSWINSADSRTSLVLPLATAMLGALAAAAPSSNSWAVSSAIFSALAVLLLFSSILFCGLSAFPRTEGPKGSILFFDGIASIEQDQYVSKIQEMDESSYLIDLAKQSHVNAQIASIKFKWIKRGMAALLAATIPWSLAIYLIYTA